ncbi:hypothetical protein [Paludisphaera soli]|uniref:hypothetical protein n=1 Tax=Paludisphaera soli TaxID=2712865 RepID=UPI0013EA6081|nr:hypothetical protein [Paludisphaera soli]
MKFRTRRALALFAAAALSSTAAEAQGLGSTGSLGGYGAAPVYSNPGMGGGGSMIIPYGGMFEGFMPSREGGGNSLAFRSRPSAAMGSARTSFSLSPLSGGMGRDLGARASSSLGSPGGMRVGSGMGRRPAGLGGMGVMPPSFGYPFRQPPSPVPAATPGAGMSM